MVAWACREDPPRQRAAKGPQWTIKCFTETTLRKLDVCQYLQKDDCKQPAGVEDRARKREKEKRASRTFDANANRPPIWRHCRRNKMVMNNDPANPACVLVSTPANTTAMLPKNNMQNSNLASADVLDLKRAAQCNKKPFHRPLPDAVAVQAMFLRAAKGN